VDVAAPAAEDADPAAELAALLAELRAELADPDALERAELTEPLADASAELRDPEAPPRPKMVVEPIVEVMLLPPEAMVVNKASVVMAEELPPAAPAVP